MKKAFKLCPTCKKSRWGKQSTHVDGNLTNTVFICGRCETKTKTCTLFVTLRSLIKRGKAVLTSFNAPAFW